MATVRITESDLERIIQKVIKERTSLTELEMPQSVKDELMGNLEDAGYIDDEVEVEELPVDDIEDVPTEKTDTDWNTIGDFFKDYYAHARERFSRVSPNEFDEITVLINAIVSLAGDINLDNKDAGTIVQQLTKRVKDQISAN
jgi:hypothetical protein|tara:strand:+ start:588 stop:1016 length:429 start_codon:yes stop_codon:yes gene_type:complete